MEWIRSVLSKKKPVKSPCRICFCEKKQSCLHLCKECIHIIKKYYPYDNCPFCLELFEISPTITMNPQYFNIHSPKK